MSKRNAANFPTVSTGRHYKRPKTKAEEFLEYLKALGFPTRKYTKPEHYEYLFQRDESRACIRFLMKNIKPTNIICKQEMKQFKQLEAEGRLLFGKDLEYEVARHEERERLAMEKNESFMKKREEMEAIIRAKKENIARLKRVEAQVDAVIELERKEKSRQVVENESWAKKCEFLDEKIGKQMLELKDKNKALQLAVEDIAVRLLGKPRPGNANSEGPEELFVWQNKKQIAKVVADEEELMKRMRHMVENLGTGLISSEHEEVNPVIAEEMNALFNQNIKEIDRLKHVIVFEALKKLQLRARSVVKTQLEAKKAEILAESKRISSEEPAIRKRILSEVAHKTELIKKSVGELRKQRANEVKTRITKILDEQIKGLKDVKKMAKRRVDKFLKFVVGILSSQRARLEFGLFAVKYHTGKADKVIKGLKGYSQQLDDLKEEKIRLYGNMSLVEEMLCRQHPVLSQAFINKGIPVMELLSHDSALVALKEAKYISDHENSQQREVVEKHLQDNLKHLYEINSLWNKSWSAIQKELKGNSESQLIETLEAKIVDKRAQLHSRVMNKDQIIRDVIARKRSKCEQVKELLAEFEKDAAAD